MIIFGSRAMGNYKAGSDIDIAIKGGQVTHRVITKLRTALEETTLPYEFDLAIYDKIQNKGLKAPIDECGGKYTKDSE